MFVGIYGTTYVNDEIYSPGTPGANRRYTGIYGQCQGDNQPTVGITSFGVRGRSDVGKYVVGVYGEAFQDVNTSTSHTFGVRAEATHFDTYPTQDIALYAEVKPDPTTGNFSASDRSIVVVGASTSVGPQVIISDENVKSDINQIENAGDILQQLNPVTYFFQSPENRNLPLGENLRYGLIAQEVQDVLPEIVYENNIPEVIDSTGVVEGTGLDLPGIEYNSLIPILIKAFQEQNVQMVDQIQENAALEEQVASLESQLQEQQELIVQMQEQMSDVLTTMQATQSKMNNCCGNPPVIKGDAESGSIELEQNFPNPFDTETAINFSISEPAQIRLEISDSQGRVLEVLLNQRMTEGAYSERWDATQYAPGTYYYSLYADTELLTKKMIKR